MKELPHTRNQSHTL